MKVSLIFLGIGALVFLYNLFFDKKVQKKISDTPIKKKHEPSIDKIFQPIDYTEGVEVEMAKAVSESMPRTAENFVIKKS